MCFLAIKNQWIRRPTGGEDPRSFININVIFFYNSLLVNLISFLNKNNIILYITVDIEIEINVIERSTPGVEITIMK